MPITSFTPGFPLGTPSIQIPKLNLKGLTQGLSDLFSLAGFNQLQNANKLSLSNTPQVSLKDFKNTTQKGLEGLGNINIGLVATMALPMVTGALKSAADKPLQNMTPEQRLLFEAIYGSGDSVLGDLFNMKQNVQNSIDNINSNIHTNTGALGSTLALADSFNNTNFDAFKLNNDKMSFGQGLSRIADSAAKGFSTGMATGNPFIGLFAAAVNALGSGARMAFANKNRNTINNAAELAKTKTINNQFLLAENTQKQMNLKTLANANYAALGGLLNYNIDDKYLANDYMSKLNNRVYKPLFDSMNYFAMGGMPDFNEFNTGGTHELNPNGGIPQGMDKLGVVNTVELGETKTTTPNGDYIFSDRLKLSKEECKQLGVPKDSTYAEASKLLRKEYDEMPNDDIAKRGWEQSRDMLIQSLEMQKQEIALKEARKQGLNSSKMLGVNPQVMQDMYYNENPQEEALLQQGINPNIQNAFGGHIKLFYPGGPLEEMVADPTYINATSLRKPLYRNFSGFTTEDPINYRYFEESPIYTQEPETPSFLEDTSPWFVTNQSPVVNNSGSSSVFLPIITELNWPTTTNNIVTPVGTVNALDKINKDVELIKTSTAERKALEQNTQKYKTGVETKSTTTDNINDTSKTFNVENLKYAPIMGNIAGLALNLFTPEDYSIPNRLLKEIDLLPRVSVLKNTNYMTFNPVDVNRYINQYNANAAAQRNAIMNTSNPNRNVALASAIYNANIGYGDLVQAIEAQNAKEKQAVQQFNAGIDQLNIANQLQADNINQNYEQMRINGIMQELAMRDAIQTARANAIQSNLKGLTDNMYNVYLDDQARRQAEIWHAGLAVPLNLKMLYLNKSINDLLLYTGLKNQGYDLTTANNIMKSMGIDISNLKWK